MITTYKYLKLEDGILVVFEKGLIFDGKNMPLDFVMQGEKNYLAIIGDYFILLEAEILEWLKETKKLYIAKSEIFDTKMEMQGAIELDDISIGKLLAWIEIKN